MTRRLLRHWVVVASLAALIGVTLVRVADGRLTEREVRGNHRGSGTYAATHGPDSRSVSRAGHTRTVGHGQIRYDGAGPERWAYRYRVEHRRRLALQQQHRRLRVYAVRLRRRLEAVHHPTPSSSSGGYSVPAWFRQQALCIYSHENGGYGWAANTGNGFYGGLQFTQDTWERAGGTGNPADATPDEQIYRAYRIVTEDGGSWHEWPATSRMCGLA